MQKKLIALAIAGIAAAPAFAQSSNVTIYGRAHLGFDNYSATGATAGSAADFKARNRVYDYGSRIGFKGSEDLGNGLKARFQIESGVNMDTGGNTGQSGGVNSSTGFLGSRQSYVALGGHFGEVRAGRQEVHWTGGRINMIGANELGENPSIATGGSGMVSGPAHRTSNVLMYVSPNFSGLNAQLGYIANGELAVAGADVNGKGYTINVNYNNGPYALKYDYTTITAQNPVLTPATGTPVNSGHKLLLGYFYQGKSHVGLSLNSNKNENKSAVGTLVVAGDDLKQTSWDINWEHHFGNFQTIVDYGEAAGVSGMTGTTAVSNETKYKQFTLAGLYYFSKRTHAYVEYTQATNKSQNWSGIGGGGISSAGALGLPSGSRGADPRIIGVGLMHNF